MSWWHLQDLKEFIEFQTTKKKKLQNLLYLSYTSINPINFFLSESLQKSANCKVKEEKRKVTNKPYRKGHELKTRPYNVKNNKNFSVGNFCFPKVQFCVLFINLPNTCTKTL